MSHPLANQNNVDIPTFTSIDIGLMLISVSAPTLKTNNLPSTCSTEPFVSFIRAILQFQLNAPVLQSNCNAASDTQAPVDKFEKLRLNSQIRSSMLELWRSEGKVPEKQSAYDHSSHTKLLHRSLGSHFSHFRLLIAIQKTSRSEGVLRKNVR